MNEQLIQQIQTLIAQLERERQALQEGSSAYSTRTRQINAFASDLQRLTGQASASAKEIGRLTAQYEKFFAALQAGQNVQVRLGGGFRTRSGQYNTEFTPGAAGVGVGGAYTNNGPDFDADAFANMGGNTRASSAGGAFRVESDVNEDLKNANAKAKDSTKEAEKLKAERAKRKKILEEEAKARYAGLGKILPGGDESAQKIGARAAALGFKPEDLKSISTEASTGISKVKFQMETMEGVSKSATFTVDKFGQVLVDTQRRFQSFGTAIAKDIVEFTKWSIAAAAVYVPLQKLSELTELMIKNESALADVTVTLANSTKTVGEIFAAANDIAQQTGEELSGVIEAYNLAYRATGQIADENERFITTNKLLADSIILSKLSTLDQAQAIDTLSAAIKQTSNDMTKGTDLLDKWVKVTQVANVDLSTLATGFAVVGEAADSVGLKTEQLSAVLAIIAETGVASGKEVANTARAMVAGFQTDTAVKALNSLGISITDSTGKTKDFLALMQEIKQLSDAGIIDPDQFSRLTYALGGGSRRQAAFQSFIQNLGKIDTITAAQEDSQGAAADALGKKLDTVQTATTRLGNAFQELAQALGESGGLLDTFKSIVDILTVITTALSKVTDAAGKAGPALYAAIGAVALISNSAGVRSSLMGINAGIAGGAQSLVGGAAMARGASFAGAYGAAAPIGRGLTTGLPYAAGAIMPAMSAIGNFQSGETAKGWGNVLGGAAGLAIGASLGGPLGATIGAALGSFIAEGIVNSAQDYKPEFADLFNEAFAPPTGTDEQEGKDLTVQQQKEQKAISELRKFLGEDTGAGSFVGQLRKGLYNVIGKIQYGADFKGLSSTQAMLTTLETTTGISAQDKERIYALFREAAAAQNKTQAATRTTESAYAPQISAAVTARREELRGLYSQGDLGAAPYRRGQARLDDFSATASQFYNTVGKEFKDSTEFFEVFSNVIARGTDEDLEKFNDLKQFIIDTGTELENLTAGSTEYNNAAANQQKAVAELASQIRELNTQIIAQVNLLEQVDFSQYNKQDIGMIIEEAMKLQTEDMQAQVELGLIDPEAIQAMIDSLDPLLIKMEEGYDKIDGLMPTYLQKAEESLKEQNRLMDKMKGIGFQTFDMSKADFKGIINGPKYDQMKAQLEGLGYKPQEEEMINVLNDGVSKDRKDWKIVQYLLQEILKTEQKALDGMFNLPDGASFWIPYEAAKLIAKEPSGGTGGIPEVTAPGAEEEIKKVPVLDEILKSYTSKGSPNYKLPDVEKEKPMLAPDQADQMKKFREADAMYPVSPAAAATESTGFLGEMSKFLTGLLTSLGLPAAGPQLSFGLPAAGAGAGDITSGITQALSNLSTRLNLSIENKTTLNVDGKQLAAVVKQYLKSDLVRYTGTGTGKNINVI